jgi:AIPR protein
MSPDTWQAALDERDDLEKYGSNGLGLFALVLHFGLEDIESVATDAVVDGSDDKKCDIVYIDRNERVAVIAQCYESQKAKVAAPANKASDLSTAIGWLVNAEAATIPLKLRSAAQMIRQALDDQAIDKILIWYVHNLPENQNVAKELRVVATGTEAVLKAAYPKTKVQVHAQEVGTKTLELWYVETLTPILVTNQFIIPAKGAFELKMGKWKACVAAIPTSFLRQAYRDNGVRLFSANVRDYLGARRSDSNINNAIMQTAKNEPENFWAYNNGITVLVNDFSLAQNGKLTVRGLSVVNGAQTTGALGSVNDSLKDAFVQARFIKTGDQDIVSNVIRYNNSQNRVTAADFRSTDRLQKRLREEFASIPDAEYEGGRRGGSESVIRRRKNLLPSFTVGQAVASLHGEPSTAYNEKTAIWERDNLYTKYFNESTSAVHLVFAYSLLRSVEARKLELVAKAKGGNELTKSEDAQVTFFRNRGATFLAVAAVAGCLEVILNRNISSMFRLSFGEKTSPQRGQEHWSRIVSTLAPMFPRLEDALKPRLDNPARVKSTIDVFRGLVEATAEGNRSIYAKFKSTVQVK